MTVSEITLVVADTGVSRLRRWWQDVVANWPIQSDVPPAGWTDPETLLTRPESTPYDSVVVAAFFSDDTTTSPLVAADVLDERRAPALLLFDDDQRINSFEGRGFVVARITDDPAFVAAALHTLATRQPTIRMMRDELHLANVSRGKVRGELARFQDELDLAQAVQRELIPSRLPDVAGLDIGVLFRPCGYVSGDIYDIRPVDETRVAFFLADAVGHGVPAALLTMIVAQTLRQCQPPFAPAVLDPAEAISRLNRELLHVSADTQRFVTGVYGLYDVNTRAATLCIAGHPPPLRIRGAEVGQITAGGPLLGVFEESVYEQETVVLAPNEALVIYSDGLETAFHAPEDQSIHLPTSSYLDHLQRVGHNDGDAVHIQERLYNFAEALDGQAGSLHQDDDMTVLAMSPRAMAAAAAA